MKARIALLTAALALHMGCKTSPEEQQLNQEFNKAATEVNLIQHRVDEATNQASSFLGADSQKYARQVLDQAQASINHGRTRCNSKFSKVQAFCTENLDKMQYVVDNLNGDARFIPRKQRDALYTRIDNVAAYLRQQAQTPIAAELPGDDNKYDTKAARLDAFAKGKIAEICSVNNKDFQSYCIGRIGEAHVQALQIVEQQRLYGAAEADRNNQITARMNAESRINSLANDYRKMKEAK
jgi:hypothetical protein